MQTQTTKKIAILGSTGSIGRQALEVVRRLPGRFSVELLTAQDNVRLLAAQAREFLPRRVVIGNQRHREALAQALQGLPVQVRAGREALSEALEDGQAELVLTAMVGIAGLEPTIRAIRKGRHIALANKETLVAGGQLIMNLAREHRVAIIPVDSEHSAIFQCLIGEHPNRPKRIILTASGGPFRGMRREELAGVSMEQALNHPNWDMGHKITIDSATMMNKGLEVIEARWLFGLEPGQIDVIVHPQSIVHSLVEFSDGSIKAQMGLPDMKLPIQFALTHPERIDSGMARFRFEDHPVLNFESPDRESFPCLDLAYRALGQGGNMPCILNAANETVVAAFLGKQLRFTDIPDVIVSCMEEIPFITDPSLEDLLETDRLTRKLALEYITKGRPEGIPCKPNQQTS